MFSLVRSRLFYLVYMQLLVFFTLLFRTPYILYIFWIIYISSYTKVHFFSLRACYGILQFYGQWRSTHCVEIISEKHCFLQDIYRWLNMTLIYIKPKSYRRFFFKLEMNGTAIVRLWLTFMNLEFSWLFLVCLYF